MSLDTKKLVFFNKEGYPMNLNYDDNLNMWNGKMYFDKNSTDTYKTQGIYMFEKIDGTNNTFDNVNLKQFQIFNTGEFRTYPKIHTDSYDITDISLENTSSNYNTKWITAEGIDKTFYAGMWCYFTGLEAYHNTDFNHLISGNTNAYKVLYVKKNKILIYTNTTNDNTLSILPFGAKVYAMDIIEVETPNTITYSDMYPGRKISYVTNTNNTGVYTINNKCVTKHRYNYLFPNLTVVNNDYLNIQIKTKTTNTVVFDGNVIFDSIASTITVLDIPVFLKVGDIIYANEKVNTLNIANKVEMQITSIDKVNNIISVSTTSALVDETVDCTILLNTNILTIKQPIIKDVFGNPSLALTYWSIYNTYDTYINNVAGSSRFKYNRELDTLQLISDYTDNYIEVYYYLNNDTPVLITPNAYNIYPFYVNENILETEIIETDATEYKRIIKFTTIDTNGISLKINGKIYTTEFDTDILTTINNFYATYSLQLNKLGIVLGIIGTDSLLIQSYYPNVSIFIEILFGDLTVYTILYKDIEFKNIKSQLTININDKSYVIPFTTDDSTTVTNWVNLYKNTLYKNGVIVSNINNILTVSILDPETVMKLEYNIGYMPISGDLDIKETVYYTNNSYTLISSNEIEIVNEDLTLFYSTGQKISINNVSHSLLNKSYNIISITPTKIGLSYQGAFWNETSIELGIISDFFIRYPRYGYSNSSINATMKWTWKDTQNDDFFFYDFSGNQLQPYKDGFPEYNGIIPLCGEYGDIELKLNKLPNTEYEWLSEPTKQQTVFDIINYTLPNIDTADAASEPDPLQLFIGYNTSYEGFNKARLYLELNENIVFNKETTNTIDNIWTFTNNTITLNSLNHSFLSLGFAKDQVIQIDSDDITSDDFNLVKLKNNGKKLIILDVTHDTLTVDEILIDETSVVSIPAFTEPKFNILGEQLYVNRFLNVIIKIVPRVITYIDVYGESEAEDERHRINLDNKNLNILKLKDAFIFKEIDINEEGIDWIFLNRKRKELIEIYPEIFNNLASYKSVIQAINFFGYNDLTFTEYVQNINPESKKFGQLMNMEIINIFNKNVKGWEYSNQAYENLRNEGYRKTNLFSLNYKITDLDGNFVNAYSLEEVKIKLLGLKKWLTENIIPLGTKIIDINGEYTIQNEYKIVHETYMSKNFRVEEYSYPINFNVYGNLQPINNSDLYNIEVEFTCKDISKVEWYEYVIYTFNTNIWDSNIKYIIDDKVYYQNKIYKCVNSINSDIVISPDLDSNWIETTLDNTDIIQIIRDYKYDLTNTSFTIDKNLDPHFIIEVYWHSGYATTLKNTKMFSVVNNTI